MAEQARPDPDFIQKVKTYLDICKDLEAAREEMKVVNESKKVLEESILEYMEDEGIDELEADGGVKIRLRTSKSTKPLNKDLILETLAKVLKKEEAEALTEQIVNGREVTEKSAITRIAPRKKRRVDA